MLLFITYSADHNDSITCAKFHCDRLSIFLIRGLKFFLEFRTRSYLALVVRAPSRAPPLSLHRRHNERYGVSNHQPHDCFLNCLFRRRSKKTPKLRFTGLCAGNSSVTGEVPAHKVSNTENVSIWWCHHGCPGAESAIPLIVAGRPSPGSITFGTKGINPSISFALNLKS